jgi:hypothetical protein
MPLKPNILEDVSKDVSLVYPLSSLNGLELPSAKAQEY